MKTDMKEKMSLLLAVLMLVSACRSYDISALIYQEDIKKQIAAGYLKIRIEEDQIPYVSDLLLDEDPLIRLAALKIMESNRYEEFLTPLLETTLDEDDKVSAEAYRILEEYPDWTLDFLEGSLETLGDLLCLNALQVLADMGNESSREFIVALFDSGSDRKKNGAARILAGMVDLESPLVEELRTSPLPSHRAGYYRIVGHYGDPSLIPLLFEGIGDDSPDVWGACISAIYRFGEDSFPYVDRYIRSGDYLMSLSCLQILEAVKSEKSLPLLISFYTDSNRLLAQKAAIIVQSYGEGAVPYLGEGIREGEDYNNRLILWTLREINSSQALPLYLELLDLQDPVLQEDLLSSLSALGEPVRDEIRTHIHQADPAVAAALVSLLAEDGDSLLLDDERCAYYLISRVSDRVFDNYFPMSGVEKEAEEDFRSLKRALELNRVLRASLNGENRYFRAYRELLLLRDRADRTLERALELRRESLSADDEGELASLSAYSMDEYDRLSREIEAKENELDRLPLSEQKEGEELIFRYLDTRRELVDIWIGISPRFRSLARRIYDELVEDIDDILRDVSRSS
ncbi:MAG: HEAT repeat domain-containing protein [Spirochaetales bacterium]|nr:HEAT repeat domain-containing protein [Spirochaetales bacterium]